MKSIKVNKSTFIEGSLTNSPQCVGPTHLHRRQHRESLHKAHLSAYRQEKQLPEFRQTNGKDYYVIHPIKSQKITTVCHLHWSQVTKTIINISCFGSWGPTQTRGRPKPRNRWWVLPTLSNINQSGGWMIYQLAHKTISKAPLRCSLDSQTEDVNNLMLQARVQTLLYVCPPAPAHQDTWKRDREQSLSSCGYQCILWLPVNLGRVTETAVGTDTPSSNRQVLLDTQDATTQNKSINVIIHYPAMLSIIHC